MTPIRTRTRVDEDGVIRLAIPVDRGDAGVEVLVSIVPAAAAGLTAEQRLARLSQSAGAIDDSTFGQMVPPISASPTPGPAKGP